MAARAPQLSTVSRPDDVLARVLDAVQRAPLVPLSDPERALLAEVEDQPVQWISSDDFMSGVRPPPR
jgi:hypothetical protein